MTTQTDSAAALLARMKRGVADAQDAERAARAKMVIANRYGWGTAASDAWGEAAHALTLAEAGLRAARRLAG